MAEDILRGRVLVFIERCGGFVVEDWRTKSAQKVGTYETEQCARNITQKIYR